mmetsp:Transcript_51345/g.143682  ORF Transcript_51345/g.143682 Transcript_51345/m.143682 type:complete len:219 (-) Transcript_51345:28-684(-)
MTDNRVTGTSVNNTSRLGRSWQRITYQQWMEAPSDMWVQTWELLGTGDDDVAFAKLERLMRHDPDQATKAGSTNGWMLQHQAAAFNCTRCLDMILSHEEASVNSTTHSEWTALHWAASRGAVEATQVLLQHGADPELRNGEEKKTALRIALDHGHEDVADLLDSTGEDNERLVGTAYTRPGTLGAASDELNCTKTKFHDPATLRCIISARYAKSSGDS